ncbi:hypothetical protein TNCV_3371141 [Trichonephila clavipes]|nr:hypothetical protein TNCV_3371141 [Trichonephila clavipes]
MEELCNIESCQFFPLLFAFQTDINPYDEVDEQFLTISVDSFSPQPGATKDAGTNKRTFPVSGNMENPRDSSDIEKCKVN